jgi:UDP-2-acetamido-3-amino-2,3-dideoxy-glucuronate N-acetyltransferase
MENDCGKKQASSASKKRDVFVHKTAEVSEKASVGEGTKVWNNAQVREGAVLGRNCIIGKNAYIDGRVKVGSGVKIQNNVCIYYKTVIEDDVMIGPNTVFTNDLYPRAFIWSEERRGLQITVKKGASIGANSTIICGRTIGNYAIVGAGSVVTRDVPDHGLVYGNPATLHGFVCECGAKLDLGALKGSIVVCSKCKKKIAIDSALASGLKRM